MPENPYAKQFVDEVENPDVERIKEKGLLPKSGGGKLIKDETTGRQTYTAPSLPTKLTDFEGISCTGWYPPDPIIAVGPNHIVVAVNSSFSIYAKDGTYLYGTTFSSWFSNVSPPGMIFDPKVAYDYNAGRWIILTAAKSSSQSSYIISVSDDSDPTGNWWNWNLDATLDGSTITTNWADYPQLGFDSSFGVYLTSNQFSFSGGFQYAKIRVLQKSELYWVGSGGSIHWYDFYNGTNANGSAVYTWQPVETIDSASYEYIVNTNSSGAGDAVTLWQMTKAWPPSLSQVNTISIGSFSAPPDAVQLGGSNPIDTGDARLLNGSFQNGCIYTVFSEGYNWGSGTVSAIRFLKIDPSNTSPVLNYTFGGDGYYYFYPAIYQDSSDDIFLIFNRSSSSEYVSVRYTVKTTSDSFFRDSSLLKAGEAYYVYLDSYGRNRWGDYNGVGLDPSASRTFWIFGEYAKAGNTWGTRIGEISCASTTGTLPTIQLDKANMYFGATSSSVSTGAQPVSISNTGGGTLNWSAAKNASWITVSPTSGTGNAVLQIGANPSGLAVGKHQGTISITDPNATNSPQTISVTLNIIGTGLSAPPFGDYSTPLDGTTGIAGAIPVTGWALDDIEVTGVTIYRNPVAGEPTQANGLVSIGDAVFVEGARPDVEAAYPNYPFNDRAGWGYMMLTNFLPNQGNGTFKIYAYATDSEGNTVLLGMKTITCSNAAAVKPFGTIDTPAQGGDASGNAYVNFGWVLTPKPNTVPIDGSTISVWVDGVQAGVLNDAPNAYDQYRSDIATDFPGLNNSAGPVGFSYLDTTAFTNGVHTIYWIATDNAANADGIGSRYFNIANTGTSSSPSTQADQSIGVKGLDSYKAAMNVRASFEPRRVKRGFNLNDPAQSLQPDKNGVIRLDVREVERVELDLKPISGEISTALGSYAYSGFLVVGNQLRPLPIGSTLDQKKGIFTWLPGPGFLGHYQLVFLRKDKTGKWSRVTFDVKVIPKFGFV